MKKPSDYRYRSVLLIDDNELDNFINQKTIEASRFARHVFVNTSGRSAIEFLDNLFRMDPLPAEFPQVIFVDINMPAMDGFQFLAAYGPKLREYAKETRFVILTSSLSPNDEAVARGLPGGVEFIRKPLNPETLDRL